MCEVFEKAGSPVPAPVVESPVKESSPVLSNNVEENKEDQPAKKLEQMDSGELRKALEEVKSTLESEESKENNTAAADEVENNGKEVSKELEMASIAKKKPFLGPRQSKKLPSEKAPKLARNLAQYLDLSKSMCLNDLAPTKFLSFIEGEKLLSGIGTGQLNLVYQFTDVNKVTVILFIGIDRHYIETFLFCLKVFKIKSFL